jgi:V/A-type H+-transporting ATPase subunit A
MATTKGTITGVAGPVVHALIKGSVNDLVSVGNGGLMGEIIELRGETAVIQVYEDTQGLTPGEVVENTKQPLSVELGPGILGMVYDGTQRPLEIIKQEKGIFIPRGVKISPINREKKWEFVPFKKKGQHVKTGDIIGEVKENSIITHKILVPQGIEGSITDIKKGNFTVDETVAKIGTKSMSMLQTWSVRKPRTFNKRLPVSIPLISGQRVLDFLFPVTKGGVAAIPGPFGAGKTVTQQQFAKWCDADIIVYIGCGERGNEMTEILEEFPHLKDPKSGKPLMERTILIANTSNMPVAAREASIYTGITIAEYFRDQGYNVALMADSTSRWAEAMREIGARLEEMPGEEGYPAYLSKKLAEFYERAGYVETLSGELGSVTVIGAVSPPGGDFSEPVTQNTLRIARCFWALDAKLANKRHFPSINWLQSYSLYHDAVAAWYSENAGKDWVTLRKRTEELLQKESELQEIVQLVGLDSLPKDQQLLLFIARMIREDFLQQNAFHDEDTYCPLKKQAVMIRAIFAIYDEAKPVAEGLNLECMREDEQFSKIGQLKYEKNSSFDDKYGEEIIKKMKQAIKKHLEVEA